MTKHEKYILKQIKLFSYQLHTMTAISYIIVSIFTLLTVLKV